MPRFFVKPEDIGVDSIKISGDEYNHIKNVLRLKASDIITVSDGMGTDYTARIGGFESNCVMADIISSNTNFTEPPIEVTLFQGIPKSDKMDLIIQKSIELGVKRIVPVKMERTVVKFGSEKDVDSKVTRWQRIALEASKQCNRGRLAKVERPVAFDAALELSGNSHIRILPYENEKANTLKTALENNGVKDISVFIGPEGGFTEEEVRSAELANVIPVTLGPRILRTETAGIVVLSILMYELGDVGK
jgi:16S rRNA (uracil1498-N3)-methyltransferase